ncbi:MAG: T9SS type A sorting domain-containing protein, partial [Bacteroidia bacterium]|nr:T9SS type A sorting domain-containing protein [Bacteroidia bacterium]MBP7262357.1 T9SS type A sorting domain-containing protein [Bacteroidia bacterium]
SSVAILQHVTTKATYNAAKSTRSNGGTTGITSVNGNSINLYPNPANTLVYTDELAAYDRIELSDLTGKVVLSHALPSASIDVSSLPAGLYVTRVYGKTGVHAQRLLIQH